MSAIQKVLAFTAATMLVLPALTSCERPADRTEAVVRPTDVTWKEIPVDDRLPITVNAATRQAVLAEMRTLLNAVQGVVGGVAVWDTVAIRNSARSAGLAAASEAEPGVQAELGPAFVMVGMRTHLSFDSLAHDAGTSREVVLTRLATVMGNCIGCHNQWRLVVKP